MKEAEIVSKENSRGQDESKFLKILDMIKIYLCVILFFSIKRAYASGEIKEFKKRYNSQISQDNFGGADIADSESPVKLERMRVGKI